MNKGRQDKHFEFGPFVLDPQEHALQREGQPIQLPPKAFEMLLLLVERSGHLVEKDELMQAVWPDTFVEEGNLSVHVALLRKALGEKTTGDSYIETVPRHGYRFTEEVRQVEGESLFVKKQIRSSILTTKEEEITLSAPAPVAAHVAVKDRRVSKATALALGLAVLLAVATGIFLYLRSAKEAREAAATVGPIQDIVVLPFALLGADTEDEYLGLGIADALITRLSGLSQLRVRPTSAVVRYSRSGKGAQEAGRDLRVDAVLDGRVWREGKRVRVTAQLVRVSDGSVMWARSFDEEFNDIFHLQGSIAEQVAGALTSGLTGEEQRILVRRPTDNPNAYQAYLKGRFFWNKRTAKDLTRAVEYYDEAIKLDPGFALAYVGLAESYILFVPYSGAAPADAYPKAKAAAARALALDETLAEAHVPMGAVRWYFDKDRAGAEHEFKRALELNPNHLTAHHWYGEFLGQTGKFDDGLTHLRRAKELDPLSHIVNLDTGMLFYQARDYDRALELYRQTLEMDPNFAVAHTFIGMAYEQKRMYPEAIAAHRRALDLAGRVPLWLASLGRTYAAMGMRREALAVLAELEQLAREQHVSPYVVAQIYKALGDDRRAFALLGRAHAENDSMIVYLTVDPNWDSYRHDPRFLQVMSDVGFTTPNEPTRPK